MKLNHAIIIGRVTRDIDLRSTASGKSVVTLTLAVNRDNDNADFIPCTAWGKTAELLSSYVRKGDELGLIGELHSSSFEDAKGNKVSKLEVSITKVMFGAKAKSKESAFDTVDDIVDESELPF